jgi:hypothetical protein
MSMRTMEIRGEMGQRVSVTLEDYERTGPQENPHDANWLRCAITAQIGRFHGDVDASLTADDFSRFSSEIENLTEGAALVASFTTMEEALTLRIEAHRAGRATVTGTLRASDSTPLTSLSFVFESDLSYLGQLKT